MVYWLTRLGFGEPMNQVRLLARTVKVAGVMLAVVVTMEDCSRQFPASAPDRLRPQTVTVLLLPTFLSEKTAVPPVRVTLSPPIAEGSVWLLMVAAVVPL